MSALAILYGSWGSSCTWRVRAALTLKRVPFEERQMDIVKEKKQLTEEFRSINPAQKVPALFIDGVTLVESMAILQYLEDTRPEPKLVPTSPLLQKARMTEICETIVSGIQPLQNLGLRSRFENNEQFSKFAKHCTERGLETLEVLIKRNAGRYCVGNNITMADICLVPQLYNAVSRLNIDLNKFPTLSRINQALLEEEIFKQTHPQVVKQAK